MAMKSMILRACIAGAWTAITPASAQTGGSSGAAAVATGIESRNTDGDAALREQTRLRHQIASRYAEWAGSTDNANALVTGLREGKPITLTQDAALPGGGTATRASTFTPPTRPMGYGNVNISLALARANLADQGIEAPTPRQLETALMGGLITSGNPPRTTEIKGVLQLRSEGAGWGSIAQTYGVKLGSVVGGSRVPSSGNAEARPGAGAWTPVPVGASNAAHGGAAAGITRGNNANVHASGSGQGIVTAGGVGSAVAGAHSMGVSRGIVSAVGNGQGQANAKGLLKK